MDEQGGEWVSFIAKELDREYDRRDVLNTRASTAITGATTLVTISLAVLALLKSQHCTVSGALGAGSLLGALVLLLTAAVLGILAGASRGRFELAAVGDMRRMLGEELWGADNVDARNYTAQLNLVAIGSLRAGNGVKYRFLVISFVVQALGVMLLVVFAVTVVRG